MRPGRTRKVGERLVESFTADGDNGREYEVLVYEEQHVVMQAIGREAPVQGGRHHLRTRNGTRVNATQPDGCFLLGETGVTLTRRSGAAAVPRHSATTRS